MQKENDTIINLFLDCNFEALKKSYGFDDIAYHINGEEAKLTYRCGKIVIHQVLPLDVLRQLSAAELTQLLQKELSALSSALKTDQ